MAVKIIIPSPLRSYVAGASEIEVEAQTVRECLELLIRSHPGLKKHVFSESGKLRPFVSLFLNQMDIRALGGDSAKCKNGDVLQLVPAVAGG